MSVFITAESENLKAFICRASYLQLKEITFHCRSATFGLTEEDGNFALHVIEIESVESFMLVLHQDGAVRGKFHMSGITAMKFKDGLLKVELSQKDSSINVTLGKKKMLKIGACQSN